MRVRIVGRRRPATELAEIVGVFAVAALVLAVGWPRAGPDPFARQAVAWVANVAMLVTIWIGLRLRGQRWTHLGLASRFDGRAVGKAVGLSLLVAAAALVAFAAGAVVASGLAPAPAPAAADMSGYDYLRGDLPMLLLALAAVYVVSSFGEEVVYRGFLMTRVAEAAGGGRAAWALSAGVSAVVFGLAHFGWGPAGIVQTTVMGLVLAVAYLLVRRNLWVLVLAHAWIDTLLLVQMYAGTGA